MFAFLKKLIRQKPQSRAEQAQAAQGGDVKARLTLARNTETHQEILYYLAEHDPEPEVRLAVVNNRAMPVQASTILAGDVSIDVRLALAGRLVTLLPDLEQGRQSRLYAFAVQALGTLALDEVLKIRKALSSTLKDYAFTPPKIAGQLARDVEREVSEPILRFCLALSDDDLLDILKGHPADWAVEAIAGRKTVSPKISKAVIDTDNRPAGTILIGNTGAQISPETLEAIVTKARHYPEWQKPMAARRDLPPAMAEKLAEFADEAVRDILLRRKDFDEKTVTGIATVFRRRLAYEEKAGGDDLSPDEEKLSDALAMRDRAYVCTALAKMAGTDAQIVEKIFSMKAAKPIVALCWKAKLSMRLALRLQQEMGQVPPKELLYPRGGTDYPLTEEELNWQLEFLGLS